MENLAVLAKALDDLDAKIFAKDVPTGIPFARDAAFLRGVELVNLVTRYGPLDVTFRPSGFTGYEELLENAVLIDVAGVRVTVASIDDVIRSKRAANRPKDRASLPELEALRDEIRRRS